MRGSVDEFLMAACMQSLQGAFSCICLVRGVGLVAFRDPNGIRPLVLGTRLTEEGPEWCVASEDCAFGPIGFKRVRDVQPGEMVIITEDGELVCSQCTEQRLCPCIFEYIYLARPDSVLNNISVYGLPAPCLPRSLLAGSLCPSVRKAKSMLLQVRVPAVARKEAGGEGEEDRVGN